MGDEFHRRSGDSNGAGLRATSSHARRTAAAWVAVGLGALCLVAGCGVDESREPHEPAVVDPRHPAVVATPRFDGHSQMRRSAIRARSAREPAARILLLGDSITEGWARAGRNVFEQTLEPLGVANLGINGDRTEHVIARLESGELEGFDPEVIVLLIGTNNLVRDSPEAIAAGIGAIVERIRAARPQAKILLVALLPRGALPGTGGRDVAARTNRVIERAARDWPVTWIDVGRFLLDSEGRLPARISPDGLHLSGEGYARLATAIVPSLDALLGQDAAGRRAR